LPDLNWFFETTAILVQKDRRREVGAFARKFPDLYGGLTYLSYGKKTNPQIASGLYAS